MCNISQEAILNANKRLANRKSSVDGISANGIVVSAVYKGKTYSQQITMRTIRENYGRALQKCGYGKTIQ